MDQVRTPFPYSLFQGRCLVKDKTSSKDCNTPSKKPNDLYK